MKIIARRTGLLNTAPIFAVLAVILVLTLFPTGTAPSLEAVSGIPRRSAGDAILNFFLFVPLGMAIGWPGRTAVFAGILGLLVASVIELLQMLIPGRDSALTDIVLNAAGTVAGAVIAGRRQTWMRPDAKGSAILTAGSLCAAALVMTATAYVLFPVSGAPSWGRAHLALPPSPGNGAADVRPLMSMQPPLARDPVFIGRSGNDLLLRYPSRGASYGFDQPEYWGVGAFDGRPSGQRLLLSVSRDGARWDIGIESDRNTIGPTVGREGKALAYPDRNIMGPTIGRGWAALAYPDAIGRRWGTLVNGLWLFALFLPAGFWARGRSRIAAPLIVAALLAVLPPVTRVVATTLSECAGGMLGVAAGMVLGAASRQLLSRRDV